MWMRQFVYLFYTLMEVISQKSFSNILKNRTSDQGQFRKELLWAFRKLAFRNSVKRQPHPCYQWYFQKKTVKIIPQPGGNATGS